MRAVIQRVSEANVEVDGQVVSAIQKGWLILLGIGANDTAKDTAALADKIAHLRLFPDAEGRFNLSIQDIKGGFLVVSQFTLYADCRKGRRPSFQNAAAPSIAMSLYEDFVAHLKTFNLPVEKGVFQANMQVKLVNDGPVTIILDTQEGEQPNG